MKPVITRQISSYSLQLGRISSHQYGFITKLSTTTNLIKTITDWKSAIRNRHSVTVAYIDFCKTFDFVCHRKLLLKLDGAGIRGNLLKWIKHFLKDRHQRVKVGQVCSEYSKLISGVMPESCIGPFSSLFISTTLRIIKRKHPWEIVRRRFKVYATVRTVTDQTNLQAALDRLAIWFRDWQLATSPIKCAILLVNKNKHDISSTDYNTGN